MKPLKEITLMAAAAAIVFLLLSTVQAHPHEQPTYQPRPNGYAEIVQQPQQAQQPQLQRWLVGRQGAIRPVRGGWWPTQWAGRILAGRRVVPAIAGQQPQAQPQPQGGQVIGRIPIEYGRYEQIWVPQR